MCLVFKHKKGMNTHENMLERLNIHSGKKGKHLKCSLWAVFKTGMMVVWALIGFIILRQIRHSYQELSRVCLRQQQEILCLGSDGGVRTNSKLCLLFPTHSIHSILKRVQGKVLCKDQQDNMKWKEWLNSLMHSYAVSTQHGLGNM